MITIKTSIIAFGWGIVSLLTNCRREKVETTAAPETVSSRRLSAASTDSQQISRDVAAFTQAAAENAARIAKSGKAANLDEDGVYDTPIPGPTEAAFTQRRAVIVEVIRLLRTKKPDDFTAAISLLQGKLEGNRRAAVTTQNFYMFLIHYGSKSGNDEEKKLIDELITAVADSETEASVETSLFDSYVMATFGVRGESVEEYWKTIPLNRREWWEASKLRTDLLSKEKPTNLGN